MKKHTHTGLFDTKYDNSRYEFYNLNFKSAENSDVNDFQIIFDLFKLGNLLFWSAWALPNIKVIKDRKLNGSTL